MQQSKYENFPNQQQILQTFNQHLTEINLLMNKRQLQQLASECLRLKQLHSFLLSQKIVTQDYESLFVQLGKHDLQRYLQRKLKSNFEQLQQSFINSIKDFYLNNKLRASIINQKQNSKQQQIQSIQQYLINGKLDYNFIYLYICIICFLNGSTDIDNLIESYSQNSLLQMQSVIQQSDLQDLQSSLQEKDQQLRNVSKQSQVAIHANADLQGKLQLLQDQIDVQTKQIEQLQNSKVELANQKHSLEEQIIMLKTMQSSKELEESHKQIQQKLIQQCKELNSDNTKLKININEFTLQISTLKQENEQKEEQLKQLQQIMKKYQQNDQKQILQKQIEALQIQNDEQNQLRIKIQSDYEVQAQKIIRLQEENQQKLQQLDQYKLQIQLQEQKLQREFKQQNSTLNNENNNLQQKIKQLQIDLEVFKQREQDFSQSENTIQKLTTQNDQYNKQITELSQQNTQYSNTINKQEKIISELENQNQELKHTQEDINSYIQKSLQITTEKYTKQIDDLHNQVAVLQKDLNEARNKQQTQIFKPQQGQKLTYDELYNEYESIKQQKEFLEEFKLKGLLNDNAAKEVQIVQLINKLSDAGINNDEIQSIQQKVNDSMTRSISTQETAIDVKRKIQEILTEDDRVEIQQQIGISALDALDLAPDEFFHQLKEGKINAEKQLRERIENIKRQLKNII